MRTSVATVILLWASLAYGAQGWQAIQEDFAAGLIGVDKRAELAVMLLTQPEALPSRYQISEPLRDATGIILEAMTDRDGTFNPDLVARHAMALARPVKQKYYDTPQGHFRIHYDTAGTHAVYQATVDIDPLDGVPDYVNRTGEYFERAWYFECDTLQYDTPPFDGAAGGGNNLYDVYMHHYSGAYGVTWPEYQSYQRPGRNYAYTSYIYVDPTFAGFGYTDRTLPMKVTSAHEFFHAVQMAYNANAGSWFMENCATWMEDLVWDEINDNYAYLSDFMNNTHLPLTTANGAFEYGAFLWPTYLAERFGLSLVRTIWEWSINASAFVAMVQVLEDYATGIVNAFPEFATWNYLTGSRSDGQHYIEGAAYRQVRIMRTHTSYPVIANTSWLAPSMLGCNYIMFVRGTNTGRLRIEFNGADNGSWVIPVVKSTRINQHEFDMMVLNNTGDGQMTIDSVQNYVAIAIIPCLLSGSSLNYQYSAYLDTSTSVLNEAAVSPSTFTLLGNYPNPFNEATTIFFSAGDTGTVAMLDIYDVMGRRVSSSIWPIRPGMNRVLVGSDIFGGRSSGLYFYSLSVAGRSVTGRMTYSK